ncbi:RICIN domain-containing protein [Paludibacterium paludis]|uniref:Cytolethal distending toxin subunit A n=1 Tax=Paludibacterium paludis TaxID=1225769 RepID=A0A918U7Q5_9NEIS|nr:RICIN domain-containing protein [Paludibacterium paludis]GGY04256.1 hypothetical protein GCM10011289_03400 [Paludibacterium paludis]
MLLLALAPTGWAEEAPESREPPHVSLANIWSGALILVWKTSPRSWLWGYTPYDARYWGNNANWRIKSNKDSSLTFVNVATGTCMTAYSSSGLTHETCSPGDARQAFLPILAQSGAMQLKSVSLGLCVHTYSSSDYRYAFGVSFTKCSGSDERVNSQRLWTIHPAMTSSTVSSHDEL